jgi:hypothetical protein
MAFVMRGPLNNNSIVLLRHGRDRQEGLTSSERTSTYAQIHHVLTLVQPCRDANAADTQHTHLKPVHRLDCSSPGSQSSHHGRNWPQPLPNPAE